MNDLKQMTDQQLNRALAEFMGYRLQTLDIDNIYYSVVNPHGSPGPYRYTADDAFLCTMPDYSTNPVSSLEAQAAACEVNASLWARNMLVVRGMSTKMACEIRHLALPMVAQLCNASPRERAEAAYMTLSSQDLHPLREDI